MTQILPRQDRIRKENTGRPIHAASPHGWEFVRSINRPPSPQKTSVILSEATRSFTVSGAVEGPAVAPAVACSASPQKKNVIATKHREWRAPRTSPLSFLFPKCLFAAALAFAFLITTANAQLPAGTTDTTAQPTAAPNAAQLTQANTALEHRDYPTALTLLTTLAADNPHDAHILFDLGYAQDNLDHSPEAEAAYRSAASADPKYAAPHLALGLLLARNNKLPEARTELLAAATLPPEDPTITARALRSLAKIDIATNAADARDELLAALKLSSETPSDIQLSAQIAESLNDLQLAETAYTRLLAIAPDDQATTAALAHVLILQKKFPEAEALLTKALAAHPGDTPLTAQLASTYLAESDTDPAKSALAVPLVEALHQQHPSEPAVTRLLARLYAQTKQPAKADPLYASLLQQSPKDPTLLDDYGSNLIHLARFAEAEAVLKRSVADPAAFPTPEDLASAYNDLAFSASENNDPTMTLQALDLRAKVAPITAGSVFLAATAHDKLHQYKQASTLYNQFLAMLKVTPNPNFADQEWEAKHRLIALDHMK